MQKYNVYWTDDAIDDLTSIIEYIFKQNQTNAKAMYFAIKEQCRNLEQLPFRARVVPELETLGMMQYREIIYKRWRIIYSVESNKVYILLIIDSRQDIQDQLVQRILKENK